MNRHFIPYGTIFISAATLLYSMYVAFEISGSLIGNVMIVQLEPYGGVTFSHLKNFELWRLFASQLLHAKQIHMLYNVMSIAASGFFIERQVQTFRFFLVWFVSGSIGTLVSALFVEPPWNLGTGASQAVLGLAGFGVVLVLKGVDRSRWFVMVLCFSLIPAFALDFIYAGYPKPGHLVAVLIGAVAGIICCKSSRDGVGHLP